MSDWQRPTLIDLIDKYKENENLYDPKHHLYYNKQVRSKSIQNILQAVQKTRKETTVIDIQKKIQSLRTQFGQEVAKYEKSKALGDKSLLYTPRVWWYTRLQWIAEYMKMRNDKDTPLSVKLERNTSPRNVHIEDNPETQLYEIIERRAADDEVEEEDTEDISDESIQARKKRRVDFSEVSIKQHDNDEESRTIEYIFNDETADIGQNTSADVEHYNEEENKKIHSYSDRIKRRSRSFGKYIGALMQEITDDKLFFETQSQILRIVESAATTNTSKH